MTDSDYKKHSLNQLSEWVYDAMTNAEASPQEIYDTIKGVVEEKYYYHKNCISQCYELLALLNGNGKGNISVYDEYTERGSMSEMKKNLVCDKDNQSPECKASWNSFWEEGTPINHSKSSKS